MNNVRFGIVSCFKGTLDTPKTKQHANQFVRLLTQYQIPFEQINISPENKPQMVQTMEKFIPDPSLIETLFETGDTLIISGKEHDTEAEDTAELEAALYKAAQPDDKEMGTLSFLRQPKVN